MSEEEETKKVRNKPKHSGSTKLEKRRAESPQPEHGKPAPGRPQVLASEDPLKEIDSEPPHGVENLLDTDDPKDTSATERNSKAKLPAKPFDEIEDY